MDKIIFPATFVVLEYATCQNEPSKPKRKLVTAKSVADLKAKAHVLWAEMNSENEDDTKGFFKVAKEDENYFADFMISDKDGDMCLLFTMVEV